LEGGWNEEDQASSEFQSQKHSNKNTEKSYVGSSSLKATISDPPSQQEQDSEIKVVKSYQAEDSIKNF
jgi:beta-glucanase (GH16 family)